MPVASKRGRGGSVRLFHELGLGREHQRRHFLADRGGIGLGAESILHVRAHDEVEAFDTINENWRALSPMQIGRHGSGAFIFDNYIYTCSGCAFRGGWPEMTHMERIAAEQFA